MDARQATIEYTKHEVMFVINKMIIMQIMRIIHSKTLKAYSRTRLESIEDRVLVALLKVHMQPSRLKQIMMSVQVCK